MYDQGQGQPKREWSTDGRISRGHAEAEITSTARRDGSRRYTATIGKLNAKEGDRRTSRFFDFEDLDDAIMVLTEAKVKMGALITKSPPRTKGPRKS